MHMRGNSHLAAKAGLTVTVRTPFIDPSLSRSSPDVSRSNPVRISGNASAQGLTQVLKPIDEQHADIDLLVNAAGVFLPKPFPEHGEADYNIYIRSCIRLPSSSLGCRWLRHGWPQLSNFSRIL
jgi:hypothetical protein